MQTIKWCCFGLSVCYLHGNLLAECIQSSKNCLAVDMLWQSAAQYFASVQCCCGEAARLLQIVKALQSLLSKAAAVESSGVESSSASHSQSAIQPVSAQHVNQSLFHQRCQWPPVVAAVNVADRVGAAQAELAASEAMALPDAAANKAAGRKAKRAAAKVEHK